MALTLQGLSRAAGAIGAASPKVLGTVTPKTPKTPAFSPLTRGVASCSPLSSAAVSFGDLKAATPKALGKTVPNFFSQARASAAAQQDLGNAARPYAEIAHQYFLARRSQAVAAAAIGNNAPTLLGGWGMKTSQADSVKASSAPALPVLLGSSEPSAPHPPMTAKSVRFEFDPMHAAREARSSFLAKQQQHASRVYVRAP